MQEIKTPRTDAASSLAWHMDTTSESYGSILDFARILECELNAANQLIKTSVQVPGCWTCDQCGFGPIKSVISMKTGNIHENNEPFVELCPNDGKAMRPATWKEFSESNYKAVFEKIEKIEALEQANQLLEARCAVYEETLKLFTTFCTYPVSSEINKRGYQWRSELDLDYVRDIAIEALSQSTKLGEVLLADKRRLDWLDSTNMREWEDLNLPCISGTLRKLIDSAIAAQQQSS